MMDKLREAVEIIQEIQISGKYYIDQTERGKESLQTLLNLAQSVIDQKEPYKDFEDFLMDKHGEQYVGTDDMMPDDFNKWVQDLSVDEWIEYGDKYIKSFRLWNAKCLAGLEEVIMKFADPTSIYPESDAAIFQHNFKELATAIRNLFGDK